MGATLSQQAATALTTTTRALIPAVDAAGPQFNNNKGDVVVIPVDGSEQADMAFNWNLKHVHKPENQIRVLHCYEKPLPPTQFYPAPRTTAPESWEDILKKSQERTQTMVTKYEKKMKELKLTGTVEACLGRPGEAVVNAAEKHEAVMIVMGTRGLGLIRRTVLGSVSDYVVHHTKIPVTIVPKDEKHNPYW